jgi:hypothetical protein
MADLGNERFYSGRHRGKTFSWVARNDPSYHLRCEATGFNPEGMERYREYFDQYGIRRPAASRRVGLGSECFESGGYRGKTFSWVARNDPSYHLRCEATGYNPVGMERYREYFDQYGDPNAAARGERDALGCFLGICLPDYTEFE